MPDTFGIPAHDGSTQTVPAAAGRPVFILGPNGCGKSALLYRIITSLPHERGRLIVAYRQNFLNAEEITITDEQVRNVRQNQLAQERNSDSRWRGATSAERTLTSIVELKRRENAYHKAISTAFSAGELKTAESLAKATSPLTKLNRVLAKGALEARVTLDVEDRPRAMRAGAEYSLARMSDGERASVILCADILSASADSVILIDEPERHLHRAIISPLLAALFEERKDCAFIIATHEVSLPIDLNADAVVLRNAKWTDGQASSWDSELVPAGNDLPEDLVRDVLGSRRAILFVEGTTTSLDQQLYNVLFPKVSVVPKGGNPRVDQSVKALRDNPSLHNVLAYGLIDRDQRSNEDVAKLQTKGVFALPVHSVESLYYGELAIRAIADNVAESLSRKGSELSTEAIANALRELSANPTIDALTALRASQFVRERLIGAAPEPKDMMAAGPTITVSINSPLDDEKKLYRAMLANKDYASLLGRYKVRQSNALQSIAITLGFESRSAYEEAVRNLVATDEKFRDIMRKDLSPLDSELANA